MSNFKVGDEVINLDKLMYDGAELEWSGTILTIEDSGWCRIRANAGDDWGDHLSSLSPIDVYRSPLFKAMKEEDE